MKGQTMQKDKEHSRREFLKTSAVLTAMAFLGAQSFANAKEAKMTKTENNSFEDYTMCEISWFLEENEIDL